MSLVIGIISHLLYLFLVWNSLPCAGVRGQIRQRKLLLAVSDSSQQVVTIKLTVCGCTAMHCNAVHFNALHCALALD